MRQPEHHLDVVLDEQQRDAALVDDACRARRRAAASRGRRAPTTARRAATPTETFASARPNSTRRLVPSGSPATGPSPIARQPEQLEQRVDVRPRRDRRHATPARRRGRSRAVVSRECARRASTRCSRTVSPMKSSGCWNVRARPLRARACGVDHGRDVLAGQSRSAPPAGRSIPDITPNSVLLPAPFGPTRPAIVPGSTATLTSDSATRPPKRTVTSEADQRGLTLDLAAATACAAGGSAVTAGRHDAGARPAQAQARPQVLDTRRGEACQQRRGTARPCRLSRAVGVTGDDDRR